MPQHTDSLSQTSAVIESLVSKRLQHLQYIQNIHRCAEKADSQESESHLYWMNTCPLTLQEITSFTHPSQLSHRLAQWFHLGISLAPLLQLPSGWWFLRALGQLVEEWEYHFSNLVGQGMRYLRAMTGIIGSSGTQSSAVNSLAVSSSNGNNSSSGSLTSAGSAGSGAPNSQSISNAPSSLTATGGTVPNLSITSQNSSSSGTNSQTVPLSRPIKPIIQRVNGTIVYEFLRTPHVPHTLSYTQVIYSLCDILALVYRKILSEKQALLQSATVSHFDIRDIILRIDSKLRTEFFGVLSRDLNTLVMHKVKGEFGELEALLNENYNLRGERKQGS